MKKKTKKNEFVEGLNVSGNYSPDRWCEKCRHVFALLCDGVGMCYKHEDKLCYYDSTCKDFEKRLNYEQ